MKSCLKCFKSSAFVFVVMSVLALVMAGCSSGGGSSYLNSGAENGEIVVSLTDAAGDFSSYMVDVLSLNLTKADGAQVATLPVSTRIDFAQYTEMTEFLTDATVPAGTYVAATMTLDFRNADIWVENENGDNVRIAGIVDENGSPITTLEATVQLEGQSRLAIAHGIPSHLMLDFDLQASNKINFDDPASPVLTVDPFLVADVDRTNAQKIHRTRGLLDEVNLSEGSFSVILRPFYCSLADSHRLFGVRSVMTDDNTVFHIDGETYEGSDGLAALDGLNHPAPVVALGSLTFHPLQFEAWEVYAGTSVPGAGMDTVSGWVTARTGDTLTVKGASLVRSGRSFVFDDEVTVTVADTTVVTREISSAAYTKDDISIGQHITAFGTLTDTDPGNLEMDATEGAVRMMLTAVRGTVVSVVEGNPNTQLTVGLQSIGKFRVGNFDFTGTGASPENDADPENYEVFTDALDLSDITAGTPVKIKGFVEPFGIAPPDFSAFTLIDVADLTAIIRVNWTPATGAPFTDMSEQGLTVNLEGAGWLHYLVRGSVVTDLYDLPAAPQIVPGADGEGLYVLKYDGAAEIHTSFGNLVSRVEELLGEGYAARTIGARGRFDDASSVLTADVIEIRFGTVR